MQVQPRSTRFVALLTGFIVASSALSIAPAHAMDKSKKLKYGAIGLGVVGAYLLTKGKTVPAAAVAAGGYYVYKKSQKASDEERYGYNNDNRYGDNRYGYNPDSNNDRDVYPDDYSTSYRSNASVRERKQAKKYDLSPYLR